MIKTRIPDNIARYVSDQLMRASQAADDKIRWLRLNTPLDVYSIRQAISRAIQCRWVARQLDDPANYDREQDATEIATADALIDIEGVQFIVPPHESSNPWTRSQHVGRRSPRVTGYTAEGTPLFAPEDMPNEARQTEDGITFTTCGTATGRMSSGETEVVQSRAMTLEELERIHQRLSISGAEIAQPTACPPSELHEDLRWSAHPDTTMPEEVGVDGLGAPTRRSPHRRRNPRPRRQPRTPTPCALNPTCDTEVYSTPSPTRVATSRGFREMTEEELHLAGLSGLRGSVGSEERVRPAGETPVSVVEEVRSFVDEMRARPAPDWATLGSTVHESIDRIVEDEPMPATVPGRARTVSDFRRLYQGRLSERRLQEERRRLEWERMSSEQRAARTLEEARRSERRLTARRPFTGDWEWLNLPRTQDVPADEAQAIAAQEADRQRRERTARESLDRYFSPEGVESIPGSSPATEPPTLDDMDWLDCGDEVIAP